MSITAAEACKPLQMFWLDTNLYRDKIAYGFKIKVTDISINGEEQTIDDSEGYQLFADCSYTQAFSDF